MNEGIRLFQSGGAVMWPLSFASLLVVSVAIERLFFWSKLGKRERRLVAHALELYKDNPQVALARLDRDRDLPLARIFTAAIMIDDANPEEFRLAMETEAQAEIPVLKKFNNIFDAVIGLAPLFGLLGTVLGLIASFSNLKIGESVGSSANNVVGGIAEALVSTAAGLVVAIIASVFASIFRSFYQRQIAHIQEATGQLELIHRRRYFRQEVMSNE